MKFTKMHGCGNDYIYVNGFVEKLDDPGAVAKKISPRHFGVGSDGMIVINPSRKADFKMSMYNLDGSEGAMCGNGIRCVAKYVYDNRMTDKKTIDIETKAGIKRLKLFTENGLVKKVRVNMGRPEVNPEMIPVDTNLDRVINEPVEVAGRTYNITCVSMGNPHAVVFVDEDVRSLKLDEIGPAFENHSIFPDRVNTEFINVINKGEIDMRVWERGAGETFACGTGACAAVVAGVLNSKTTGKVLVHLLGGDLEIVYDVEDDTVFMTGPAETVYTGEIDIR